jgi:ATP-binding cassette subfamily C protein CydD
MNATVPLRAADILKAPSRLDAALPGMATVGDSLLAIGFALCITQALVRASSNHGRLWLAGMAVFAALRGLLSWWALRLAAARSRRIKRDLRRRVLNVLFHAQTGAARSVGEDTVSVVDDIEALDGYVVRFAPARFAASVAPMLVLAAVATASLVGAGLLLATLIPFVMLMIVSGGAAAGAARRQLDALSRLSGLFADRVRGLPLILAFQAEAAETRRVATAAREVSERTLQVLRIAFISSAGLEFFAALSVALIAVYAGFSLLGLLPFAVPETLGFAQAFFVLALAPEFYAPLRRLAAAYHEKQLGEAAASRLAALLATPQAPAPPGLTFADPPGIVFAGTMAGFRDDPDLRIGPIDLTIPAGGIVALMGPTGSGKTTLLRLLVGQAVLAAGDVTVGPYRLREAGSFAAAIAWAGQAPILLPGTIGENIALAWPDATAADIAAVAAQAGLTDLLQHRPGGLAAQLDERGSGLSGGERRRIGLARALLKPARILILDEPTANLDATSEAEMIDLLRQASQGRTVLMATHSEALAAIAHQVVRL